MTLLGYLGYWWVSTDGNFMLHDMCKIRLLGNMTKTNHIWG